MAVAPTRNGLMRVAPPVAIGEVGYLQAVCAFCNRWLADHHLDGHQTIPMRWSVHYCHLEPANAPGPHPQTWTAEFFHRLRDEHPLAYEEGDEWRTRPTNDNRPWFHCLPAS